MPTQRIGDTVVKTYSEELRWQWGREVAFLRCVSQSWKPDHFPKIIRVEDHSITTLYGGETLHDLAHAGKLPSIDSIRAELATIQGILVARQIDHRDITVYNLVWSQEWGLKLLDFGWSKWAWEPETPMPVPDVMKPTMHRPDQEQAADMLKQVEEIRRKVCS